MVAIIVALTMIIKYQLPQTTHPVSTSNISPIATVTPDINKPRVDHVGKITIIVPSGFQVEHYQGGALLTSAEGKIDIGIGSTNENSLDSDVMELESRLPADEQLYRQHVTINGQPSIMVVATSPSRPDLPQLNYKVYYFYPEQWRGADISTSTQALYPVLDQVAQSFRYTP